MATFPLNGTGGLAHRFGYEDTYRNVLTVLWPGLILNQTILMLLVWLHGMIGLHFWLRLKPGYAPFKPLLFALALLVLSRCPEFLCFSSAFSCSAAARFFSRPFFGL